MSASVILNFTPGIAAYGLSPATTYLGGAYLAYFIAGATQNGSANQFLIPMNDPQTSCWFNPNASFDVDAAGNIVNWDIAVSGPCFGININSAFGDVFFNDVNSTAAISHAAGSWDRVIASEPSALLLLSIALTAFGVLRQIRTFRELLG
jgi:hypothetical protein